jgi:hypothetical protein
VWYGGIINAVGTPKKIVFWRDLNAQSPEIDEMFRKSICGYNPPSLHSLNAKA